MSLTGGKSKGKGKPNKSLKAWVTFVKKVQKEEKLSYKDAIHRAKVRKDKGEKWMTGGEMIQSGENMGNMGENMNNIENDPITDAGDNDYATPLSEDEGSDVGGMIMGGKRRHRTMRRSRGRSRRRGRTMRRGRGRSRASRRH